MAETVRFYRVREPHGYMSNFTHSPITLAGELWPTVEHYFQAAKHPDDPELQQQIRESSAPAEAKRLAFTRPARADWLEVRDDVMLEALRAKFAQHAELAGQLLSTGDADLVEHTANDDYWADGGDGSGENRLGKLLQVVRRELQS